MLTLIIKLTLFIVQFVSTEAKHLATDYFYLTDNKICTKCSPGTYWIADCKDNFSDAECLPCPSRSFQTTFNIAHRCELCTICGNIVKNYQLARTVKSCTSDTNTVCACLEGYYLKKIYGSENEWMCEKISDCDPGYEIIYPATNFKNTVCRERWSGYFEELSPSEACRLCSATNFNTICQERWSGYFKELSPSEVCRLCSESANDGVFGDTINTQNDAEIVILTVCSIIGGIGFVLFVIWCIVLSICVTIVQIVVEHQLM